MGGLADDSGPGNDQMDIHRGRGMVGGAFQGAAGMQGTHNQIQSSSDYMSGGLKTYDNTTAEGYYISKPFLDKLTVHVAKNFMELPKIKVPLILGVWGGKGQGKTFQTHLAFQKLGVNPIVMSAGELESGNAGEPAKLVRQRYREASDVIKKGKMCSLFINDLDAGAGRMGGTTQYTVNNQMVNATLMNIADNPTNVQLPGVYNNEEIPRVPSSAPVTISPPCTRHSSVTDVWRSSTGTQPGRTASVFAPESSGRTTLAPSPSRSSSTPSHPSRSTSSAPSGPGSTMTSSGASLSIPDSRTSERGSSTPGRDHQSSRSLPWTSTPSSSTETFSSRSRRTSSAFSSPTLTLTAPSSPVLEDLLSLRRSAPKRLARQAAAGGMA